MHASPWTNMIQGNAMVLEFFLWCWLHLYPTPIRRALTRLLILSMLVLVPLVALNLSLVKRGHTPRFQASTSPKTGTANPTH